MGQCVQKTPKGCVEFERKTALLPGVRFVDDGDTEEEGPTLLGGPPGARWLEAPWEPASPEPVILNIYNVGTSSGSRVLNALLQPLGTGLFHCGVEVYGREWSYADSHQRRAGKHVAITGVFCSVPCHCEGHNYSKSVRMGLTSASEKEVLRLLKLLREVWRVGDYKTLTHNCCHFCDDLCQRLGVGSVPAFAVSMADTGAALAAHGDTRCCREVAGQTAQAAEHICCRPAGSRPAVTNVIVAKSEPAVPMASSLTESQGEYEEAEEELPSTRVKL